MDSYNSALRKVYEETFKERAVVWVTARDEKVCFICGTMDGVKFDIRDAEGLLPAHPYCRCQWVSLTEYEAYEGRK